MGNFSLSGDTVCVGGGKNIEYGIILKNAQFAHDLKSTTDRHRSHFPSHRSESEK